MNFKKSGLLAPLLGDVVHHIELPLAPGLSSKKKLKPELLGFSALQAVSSCEHAMQNGSPNTALTTKGIPSPAGRASVQSSPRVELSSSTSKKAPNEDVWKDRK